MKEAERIGLVNKVVSMTSEEKYRLLNMINTTTTEIIPKKKEQQAKQRSNKLAKIKHKVNDECCFARDHKE